MVIVQSVELNDELKKRLGELPPEPIYEYIDELSIDDLKIEEESEDIHQQSCSSTLQEEFIKKTNELLNPLDNFGDYVSMNAVVISNSLNVNTHKGFDFQLK